MSTQYRVLSTQYLVFNFQCSVNAGRVYGAIHDIWSTQYELSNTAEDQFTVDDAIKTPTIAN